MSPETIALLQNEFSSFPNMVADSIPTCKEIEIAATELGIPFDNDYAEFLHTFGGAMVGAYPIFGLRPVSVMGEQRWSVVEVTKLYRQRSVPGADKWIIFSEDHAGNPVGFDMSGKVWTHDHDFGGITQLDNSFEQHLLKHCLKME